MSPVAVILLVLIGFFWPFAVSSFAGPVTARVYTRDGAQFLVEHFSAFWNDGRGGNINPDGRVRFNYRGATITLSLEEIQIITLLGDRRARVEKTDGQVMECEEAAIGWLYGRAEGGRFEIEARKVSRIEIILPGPVPPVGKSCPTCANCFTEKNYRYCPFCGIRLSLELESPQGE